MTYQKIFLLLIRLGILCHFEGAMNGNLILFLRFCNSNASYLTSVTFSIKFV